MREFRPHDKSALRIPLHMIVVKPMDASSYFAFVFLSAAQVATPGPSTLFLVSNAVSHGRRRALTALSGDLAAIAFLASLSALGLAGLLASNPYMFLSLRLAGAAYLLWLGWTYVRTQEQPADATVALVSKTNGAVLELWFRSFMVGISNPKAILFFAALFPQFIPRGSGVSLLTFLVGTFVLVKFLILGGYALGAHHASRVLRKPTYARTGRIVTGCVFIAFGLVMLWSAI